MQHLVKTVQINSAKKRTGAVAPKNFVNRLKKDNELFRSYQHQVRACLLKVQWVCNQVQDLDAS